MVRCESMAHAPHRSIRSPVSWDLGADHAESDLIVRINRSFLLAGLFAALIVLWMASGMLLRGAPMSAETDEVPQATERRFTVRVADLRAQPRQTSLRLRGRSEAVRIVDLRAETVGRVAALPAEEGAVLEAGTPVCQLDLRSRSARVDEAKAAVRRMELEYAAAKDLSGRGFRSETQTAAALASLEAAKADLAEREVDLANTTLRAPFAARLEIYEVDVGDLMREGDTCAILVDQDPVLIVVQVSEREVGSLRAGMEARAQLVSGEDLTGQIRLIGTRADPATRTFRVEIEVPNPDHLVIRDGVTAEVTVPLGTVPAHRLSASLLSLDTLGEIGVRIIEGDDTVKFAPVTIIENEGDGVWVTGLSDPVTVVTVGQDYVVDGQKVLIERTQSGMDRDVAPTVAIEPVGSDLTPLLTEG